MVKEEKDEGIITDEALADLRSRIGVEWPLKPWNCVATKDAIWHFTEGLGDDNPLWRDEEYAARTRYGSIIAPPTFLYTCDSAGGGGGYGLPGVFALFAKDVWEWNQVVRANDELDGMQRLVSADWKKGRFAGRMIDQVRETFFFNQRQEIVAKRLTSSMRIERKRAREKSKEKATISKYRYTDEELAAIERAYEREEEQRRGDNPRYWEDVNIGDEVPGLVKGPLTVTSMVAWFMGFGSPLIKTDRIAYKYMRAHPRAKIMHPLTNVPDFSEAAHWDEDMARKSGLPLGYDPGAQRISWFAHVMTDWIGDDGFLTRLEVQLRKRNYVGDTTWCRGKVIGKREENGLFLVDCQLWGDSQRGYITTLAWATAALPSRIHGAVVLKPPPMQQLR
ncbi:MaoC family dehydratase N-terminal domain-containing protein [Thermodesulfobacteriota bacterium]